MMDQLRTPQHQAYADLPHRTKSNAALTTAETPDGHNQQPSSHMTYPQNQGRFNEEWDTSQRGSSLINNERHPIDRTPSMMTSPDQMPLRRGGTLKKKASLRRSSSRRSSRAGSVRSLVLQPEPTDEQHSAFYSPVPTTGNPTEHLAARFTGKVSWLTDLVVICANMMSSMEKGPERPDSILPRGPELF
jgi:hypothetical protein